MLDALEKKVNRHSYETWLKPTRFSHSKGPTLFVKVPNPDFCHIGDKYGDLISEAIENLGLEYQDVEFVTDRRAARREELNESGERRNGERAPRRSGPRRTNKPSRAGPPAALRLGRRGATESQVHLRRIRDRLRQPVRACGGARGGGAAFQGLQPAVPVRRRRHGQDPPDAGHRPRDQEAEPGDGHLLRVQREVHQRDDQRVAEQQDDQFPRQVPQHGCAAGGRHPVPGQQGAHPGGVLPHLQRACTSRCGRS